MADILKTIGASGADYTTLAAWWAARSGGAGDTYIGVLTDAADYQWGEVTGTYAGNVAVRPATGVKFDFNNPSAPHARIVASTASALYWRSLAPILVEDLEIFSPLTTGVCLRVGAFEDTNFTGKRLWIRGGSSAFSHGRATATTLLENFVVTGASTWGVNNGFGGITLRNGVIAGNNTSNTASRAGLRHDIAGCVIDNVVSFGNGLLDWFGGSTVNSTLSYTASGDATARGANALTGVTSAAFTNYAGNIYTAAAGGVLDNSGPGSIDRGLNLSGAPAIAITSPIPWHLSSRNRATNKGSFTITGTYSNVTPDAIHYRWSGGAWAVLDPAPAGGNFIGTATGLDAGNGTLEVRIANNTTVTASVANVAIGAKFAFAVSQSNFSGRANNPQPYTGPAGYFHKYTVTNNIWQQGADPFDTDTANGSLFPLLANMLVAQLGVPVAFIGVAAGSTTLSQWQSGQTLNTRMLNYISAAASDGLEGICCWIGESDAGNATSETDFKTRYNAVIDQLKSVTGVNCMLVAISGLALTDYANVRQWIKDIAASSANVSDTVPEMWPLYQKIHYETDTETALAADAVFDGIMASFYGPQRRALLHNAGGFSQITDAELGTGKKPLVLLNGEIKERAASEGIPIVYDAGNLRTIAAGETLLL